MRHPTREVRYGLDFMRMYDKIPKAEERRIPMARNEITKFSCANVFLTNTKKKQLQLQIYTIFELCFDYVIR